MYYRDNTYYCLPSDLSYIPLSSQSSKVIKIEDGKIVGGLYSYYSYMLFEGLDIGDRFYSKIGIKTTKAGNNDKTVIVSAFGLN